MMLLKVLTIVLGAIIVVARGAGLIEPKIGRAIMQAFIDRKLWPNLMAVVMAVYGALLFWATRVVYADTPESKYIWTFVIGAWAAVGGLLVLLAPGFFIGMLKRFQKMSDNTLRLFMLIGVIVGLAVIYLGACVY